MSDDAAPYLLALYEPDIAQNAGAIMRSGRHARAHTDLPAAPIAKRRSGGRHRYRGGAPTDRAVAAGGGRSFKIGACSLTSA